MSDYKSRPPREERSDDHRSTREVPELSRARKLGPRSFRSPEDKTFWVLAGEERERVFVESVLPRLGFCGSLNPAKEVDSYAPDLLVEGRTAELKSQRTPFFRAGDLYGIDPQFAVTLNVPDFERYRSAYPSLDLFFWVHWQDTARLIGGRLYSVDEMAGVWRASFPALRHQIERRAVCSHEYAHRLFDQAGNARASYVLDLRRFEFLGGYSEAFDAVAW